MINYATLLMIILKSYEGDIQNYFFVYYSLCLCKYLFVIHV